MTIRSKVPNEQYKENFDRIFRKNTETAGTSSTEMPVVSESFTNEDLLGVSGTNGTIK